MGKKDPALTYLKSYGYSVVRLPRQDILPGQIFARRNNDLSERGSLANVFTPGSVPLPKIRHDVVAADPGRIAQPRQRYRCGDAARRTGAARLQPHGEGP